MTAAECRRRREELGASPDELARNAGLVELTVRRFEAGLTRPRAGTLIALRKGLRALEGCDPSGRPS